MPMTPLINPVDMIQRFNDELKNIGKWITINKLFVNISKCSYMVMSTPQRGILALLKNVYLNSQSISEVDKTTFFGVVVDEYLFWKDHITYISNKIYKGNSGWSATTQQPPKVRDQVRDETRGTAASDRAKGATGGTHNELGGGDNTEMAQPFRGAKPKTYLKHN